MQGEKLKRRLHKVLVETDLMHVEQDIVCVSIVSLRLLFPCDDDRCLSRLLVLSLGHVKSEINKQLN